MPVALCAYSPQRGGSWIDAVFVDGQPAPGPNEASTSVFDRVTAGYFDVIGTPILRGRGIAEQDTETARHVAVVNEAFARRFFKGEDPIGKHFGRSEFASARQYEIVGIAKDARYLNNDLDKPVGPFFFLPEAQHDVFQKTAYTKGDVSTHFLGDIAIAVRPGASLSDSEIRRAMTAVDSNMPVILISTLGNQVAGQFSQQRLIARLTSFFGILSLVLAALGMYGVTAYNAGRRTGEIGLRMALGAGRSQVVTLVLRGTLALILLGLLIGVPLTLLGAPILQTQLYGMSPYNVTVTVVSMLALALSGLLACLIPALRASRISPLEALRAE